MQFELSPEYGGSDHRHQFRRAEDSTDRTRPCSTGEHKLRWLLFNRHKTCPNCHAKLSCTKRRKRGKHTDTHKKGHFKLRLVFRIRPIRGGGKQKQQNFHFRILFLRGHFCFPLQLPREFECFRLFSFEINERYSSRNFPTNLQGVSSWKGNRNTLG